tara:strand:- start:465 stop:692 length:228 start_codon:yes stop_codon:yes gene_type:complete
MKLYRANFANNDWPTISNTTNWHHTKKLANDEAKEFGQRATSWTIVTFYQSDHPENIRRLLNGETSLIGKEETIT